MIITLNVGQVKNVFFLCILLCPWTLSFLLLRDTQVIAILFVCDSTPSLFCTLLKLQL